MTLERIPPLPGAGLADRPSASKDHFRLLARCALIFLAARVVTSTFLLWITTQTTASSEAGAAPSFWKISSVWDGAWYRRIALHGYPLQLPIDAHGQIEQNPWAFLPAYPAITRAVMVLTGGDWAIAAVGVAVLFGAGAAVLLGVLLVPHVGRRNTFFAVAIFSCSPVSFILQMTYADSMMIFLLLAALCLLDRRRYGAAIPIVLLASMTRPGVLAFALTCGLHIVLNRRRLTRLRAEGAWSAALLISSVVGGLAWPLIVSAVTGRANAYVATEIAWRTLWTGDSSFALFTPWLFVVQQVFGIAGLPVLGVLIGLFAYFVVRSWRRGGRNLPIWVGSYGLYLLAVFMPQTSLPRLLLPMAPGLAAISAPRRRVTRVAVLALSTALQLLWLWVTYGPVKGYLTVP